LSKTRTNIPCYYDQCKATSAIDICVSLTGKNHIPREVQGETKFWTSETGLRDWSDYPSTEWYDIV